MTRLWVGVSLPKPWATRHGLTERSRWTSPEAVFGALLMEEILRELPDLKPSLLDVEVDPAAYDGEPCWEVRQPGKLVVDSKMDRAVVTAFKSVMTYLSA